MPASDERAIIALLVRYASGIDNRDWDLFATCFIADVVTDYGNIGKWQGRDVFVEFMKKGHAKIGPTMHRMTNFVVTGERNHAIATSYVDALLLPLKAGGAIRQARGLYEDKLVRISGHWKISYRRFVEVLISDHATSGTG